MPPTYLELARALPRPTDEQCAAFARGMSGRHSWYKHLPVSPTVPFRFLIAPRAPSTSDYGAQLVDKRTVHVRSADAHLEAYGYWDCLAPYSMGRGLHPDLRAEAEAASGFWVNTVDGERVTVPDDVIAAGTARVNAFVDPRCQRLNPWLWCKDDYHPEDYLRELGVEVPPLLDTRARRALWEQHVTPDHLGEARARQLAGMVDAMTRVIAMLWP